jgi:hypothetical protein
MIYKVFQAISSPQPVTRSNAIFGQYHREEAIMEAFTIAVILAQQSYTELWSLEILKYLMVRYVARLGYASEVLDTKCCR